MKPAVYLFATGLYAAALYLMFAVNWRVAIGVVLYHIGTEIHRKIADK